ncbi:MAG: O-antigen ligase family protein [Acetobacteraceae bacterium]
MLDRATLPGPAWVALAGFLLVGAACAALAPAMYWALLEAAAVAGAGVLVWHHLEVASAIWLIVAACTLEMTLYDLVGPAAFATTIALVKAAGIALAVACVLRYGPRLDLFNPAWAFGAMFVAGLAHGLHPGLTASDSLRSLVGSVAPYAFGFSRLSRRWARGVIHATQIAPLVSVAGGACLALAGLRALFVDSGGARLEALGHPAFLAAVTLAAIYASLVELYRDGRARDLVLLGVNFVILVLTGARAPLFYGTVVVLLTLGFVSAPVMPLRRRALLLLAAGLAAPVLALGMASLSGLRVFNLLRSDAGDLSGREELWPYFERAAARSPWFGWGVGSGNNVVPQGSDVVLQMHTWAAHNEWLRILVEGGQLGRAALVVLFALWCWRHTRRLTRAERAIMRLVFIAFACHAFTDNVLISTSACVLFAFCAAVFARGALEAEGAG